MLAGTFRRADFQFGPTSSKSTAHERTVETKSLGKRSRCIQHSALLCSIQYITACFFGRERNAMVTTAIHENGHVYSRLFGLDYSAIQPVGGLPNVSDQNSAMVSKRSNLPYTP